ncbi:hypothetical protein V8C37DRAFT_380946 [Trichoderma ceciliae]
MFNLTPLPKIFPHVFQFNNQGFDLSTLSVEATPFYSSSTTLSSSSTGTDTSRSSTATTVSSSSSTAPRLLRRKASKVFCTICNDHPDGFRGAHELERHMRRHDNVGKSEKEGMVKKFICRDPNAAGVQVNIQPIYPLSECEACRSQKQYDTCNKATTHLWFSHFRDRSAQGKARDYGRSRSSLIRELHAWFVEVSVGEDGNIRSQADGTNTNTEGFSLNMECDDDGDGEEEDDDVADFAIPAPPSSNHDPWTIALSFGWKSRRK